MNFALSLALVTGTVLGACADRERATPPARDPQPPRRVIEPPAGIVRPLPPHAIRADGVGPYKLGDKVASLLQQLPSGPRIVRFELPGIVRTSLIRAEDDTVLIGGETTSTATFVAVTDPEVARTESGVHVGATRAQLEQAMGPLVDDPDRARDPRLVIPSALRNLRVLLAGDRISAIAVTGEGTSPRTLPPSTCERPPAKPSATATRTFPACLTAAGELVDVEGDDIIVRPVVGETRLASLRVPGLVFAEPLRNMVDGRDEIVAITTRDDSADRRWEISLYRLEGTRFTKIIDAEALYALTSGQTRWIGAELRDVELYLELTSRTDGIEVGGLLTTSTAGKIRDVAVISPVTVPRRQGKPPAADSAGASSSARGDAGSANP